ncbi:hypothetical protein ASPWEDRAFT_110440 [Aspergillus wentii DTO 134E9]|uniref:Peptidase S9 prolyl oligopeptidase catalytic domain-containing protein n=1 Tax=Aspergillus wentii DTO 134E9 TaxID=1073089 RepID=A0A1L9RMZ7_ASPWE|nr:uncharacterized protein ASPWEDRAFT_110440 [Aspergillus wentii DTO 134E9]KAI9929299.1 hypothetical protein MW887_000766 [Aspergillus wentii]OJJ36263.1 hypothetical protein ASPWEDRAFT_110440 [Aspergillus wentii DTO 134E9]
MPSSTVPYGHWKSPLTPELLADSSISLHEVVVNESTGAIYSVECRPTENARYVIVEHRNGQRRDVLLKEFSAHATVQELGGGSIAINLDGHIIFFDDISKNVYKLDPLSGQTTVIRAAVKGIRYADFCCHPRDTRWILAAKEDHRNATPETQAYDVNNLLVAIDILTGEETMIAEGDHFYSHPKFDPSGRYVSWIQWSHPDMPWTGTVLYFGEWQNATLLNVTRLAGKAREESIAQPKWGLDGRLYFASDKTGFWQLYSFNLVDRQLHSLSIPGLEQADFAIAEWMLGCSTFIFLDESTIAAAVIVNATSKIVLIDTKTLTFRELELPYLDLVNPGNGIHRVSKSRFAVVGSSSTTPKELAIVSILPDFDVQKTVLTSISSFELPSEYVSQAEHLTAPQKHGPLRDGNVHLFYFPPQNPDFVADSQTLPPLLVYAHGGPNGCTTPALDLTIQYWTSRGFALCAVNYTGSTGFGRDYRERLSGYWGEVDIADIVSAVDFLVGRGLIDETHVGLYGRSAGGYATLQALHVYPDVWAAGVSWFGISNVRALQADSYKFESQDVDRLLLGETEQQDREKKLTTLSPCSHAEKIKAPLLLLQGTADQVVPVEQARMMAHAMHDQGRVAEVVEFEGEGHGWVGREAIHQSFERQEQWWKRYLT